MIEDTMAVFIDKMIAEPPPPILGMERTPELMTALDCQYVKEHDGCYWVTNHGNDCLHRWRLEKEREAKAEREAQRERERSARQQQITGASAHTVIHDEITFEAPALVYSLDYNPYHCRWTIRRPNGSHVHLDDIVIHSNDTWAGLTREERHAVERITAQHYRTPPGEMRYPVRFMLGPYPTAAQVGRALGEAIRRYREENR